MIRVRCPHCDAKVKAPEELAGKEGRCPACRGIVALPEDEVDVRFTDEPITPTVLGSIPFSEDEDEADGAVVGSLVQPKVDVDLADQDQLGTDRPETLQRHCHYIICNSQEVVARWDNDGKGWMIHVRDGFVRAANNSKQIPSMGGYVFIEIEIAVEGTHQRLAGVNAFTLTGGFAMQKLAKKQDNAILEALVQRTKLNDRQRALVRQRVNAKYLPAIWDDAAEF